MNSSPKRLGLRVLRALTTDTTYAKVRYYYKFRRRLNLRTPTTFNEKLQWLKLYHRPLGLSRLVDKYEVREYVRERCGDGLLNDLYGVYRSADEIEFRALPDQFVLRATHGSGWVVLCTSKASLDTTKTRNAIRQWLTTDYYRMWGEWAYKGVEPRVVCERYLGNNDGRALLDYKYYCFHGEPKYVHVDLDRFSDHRRNFYDLQWHRLPFGLGYPQSEADVPKPGGLAEMLSVARALAHDHLFVRVDLYEVNGRIYFGELTFYPGNGLELFTPAEYDFALGDLLHL